MRSEFPFNSYLAEYFAELFCIMLSILNKHIWSVEATAKTGGIYKKEIALRQINKIILKALGIKVMDVYIDGLWSGNDSTEKISRVTKKDFWYKAFALCRYASLNKNLFMIKYWFSDSADD